MTKLSSAASILHDLGLATAVGGTIFGHLALQPAVRELTSPEERDRLLDVAWRRFSAINVVAHAAVLGTHLANRRAARASREARRTGRRRLAITDALIAIGLASGVASIVAGRMLGRRIHRGEGAATAEAHGLAETERHSRALEKTAGVLGNLNVAANAGLLAMSTVLAPSPARRSWWPW